MGEGERMAKDSGPSTALLLALAAAGLLASTYGVKGRTQAPAQSHPHDLTPGQAKKESGSSGAGRDAENPAQIPARGWWDVLKRVYAGFNDDRLMTEAAGVTFYTLLAIFPAIATLVSLYGMISDPATVNDQIASLNGVVPGGGLDILSQQVKALTSNPKQALGFAFVIGLLTSIWSSNQGIKGLFDALNVVYHEKEKRSFFRRTLITLAFTLGAIVFIILAMVSIVVVPIVFSFLGLGSWATTLLAACRWPILLVVLAVFLSVIYRFGPSREHARWKWVSWGSAFATIMWLAASVGFSYYVANFGSYNKTYGSLGAAIGFMTWIWISSIIVLLGGELNAELEQQTDKDTTTGAPMPIGQRGAYKADVKL
jgi:membrane protein